MVDGLGLNPGMRLLDIGGGWGAVTQHCGARGVHVTTLTIAEDSAAIQKFSVSAFTPETHDHEPTMREWARRLR